MPEGDQTGSGYETCQAANAQLDNVAPTRARIETRCEVRIGVRDNEGFVVGD